MGVIMEKSNDMNVLLVTDENFAEMCTVAMRSVAELDKGVNFHIIQDGLSINTKIKIQESLLDTDCSVNFIDAEKIEDRFNVDVKSDMWPLVCLQRLFLTDYLPMEMEKILYLDCDVIALKSIRDIYDTVFDEGEYCAAVPDCVSGVCKRNIGMDAENPYFNSGVLLINLDLWRKENVSTRFIEIMNAYEGALQYPDQDIINMAFENHIKKIDAKYNVTSFEYFYKYEELMYYHNADNYIDKSEYINAVKNPFVFHFTNDIVLIRPWFTDSNHPLFDEWNLIREKTMWKNEKLRENNEKRSTKIKRFVARNLPRKVMLVFARYLNRKHSSNYSQK